MMRRRIHIVLVGVHEELKYVWILLAQDDGLMANCSPTHCSVTRGSWRPYFFLLAVIKENVQYDSLNLACEKKNILPNLVRVGKYTPFGKYYSGSAYQILVLVSFIILDLWPISNGSDFPQHVLRLSRRLNFSGDMNKKEVIWMHPNPTLCR